jgi:hypothetical protein
MSADHAAVASAIASAVAALAAWAAVLQASRWQRRQRLPWLHIEVAEGLDTGTVRLRIENGGGGIARGVWFWVREGSQAVVSGLPPHGLLAAGKGVSIATRLQATGRDAEAVVICRSGPRIHAWDAAGRHKKWRLNWWAFPKPGSNQTIVNRFYPHAPDIGSLRLLPYQQVEED